MMSNDESNARVADLTLRLAAVEERLRKAEGQLAAMREGLVVTESLVVQNRSGNAGFEVFVDETEAQVAFAKAPGNVIAAFTHNAHGSHVTFFNSSGDKCLDIGVTQLGSPIVILCSDDARPRIALHVTGTGPVIEIRDHLDRLRFQTVQSKQGVGIGLFHPDGSVFWSMPPNSGLSS